MSYTAIYIYSWTECNTWTLPCPMSQVDLPGSWGDVASMINASDSSTRHPPRGQKPAHTKTQWGSSQQSIKCFALKIPFEYTIRGIPQNFSAACTLAEHVQSCVVLMQLPAHSVIRRRNKSSKQQQQPSLTSKPVDKPTPPSSSPTSTTQLE